LSAQTPQALRAVPTEQLIRTTIVLYVVALVAVPLLVLVQFGFQDGGAGAWSHVSSPVARASLWLTVWTALLVGAINTVLGTATAWVLVRYRLPMKSLFTALVDLPLAIPTLVAGVMIAILYGPGSMIGETFHALGVDIVFARPGIILALLFVTLPFVVRAVEPILGEIDPAEEEAAVSLGASPWKTFRAVFFPAIFPAAISGGIRSVGRAIGEFGSIVVVAGNIPMRTLTAPVYIFGEIESGAPQTAAALSTVLLVLALALHAAAALFERMTGSRHATG
jgi:sulfate/thiosulfate transport system permease protein